MNFSPRETECLEYLLGGLSNKEIASEMAIEVSTVKCLLQRISAKSRITTRFKIALWYIGTKTND